MLDVFLMVHITHVEPDLSELVDLVPRKARRVAESNHGAEYSAERPSGAGLLVHADVIRLSGYGIDGPGYPPYLSR